MDSTYVDTMGFEHTGTTEQLTRLSLVSEQVALESQERDGEWERYIAEHGLDAVENRRNDPRLGELVSKGFPDKYRKELWLKLFRYDSRAISGYYNELFQRVDMSSSTVLEIQQDIERTFPNHPTLQSAEGRARLERVLIAYSMRNPNIGYCQSMNFLAFYLLLIMQSEEQAFWCLAVLVEEMFPDHYSRALLGAQVDQRTFTDLLDEVLPDISDYIQHLGVAVPVLCAEWFLCLFGTTLNAMCVLVVWDNVLFRGSQVVYEVGLAIMQQLRDQLLMSTSAPEVSFALDGGAILLDPFPLMLCASTLAPSKAHVQAIRMKHWNDLVKELNELNERREMRLLQEKTRFDLKKLKALREEFKILSLDGSGITFLQFQQVFNRVLPNWGGGDNTTSLLERIFEIFDEDGDKMLDFKELMCGLSIIYQGTMDEKLRLIFKSFDEGNKSYLTRVEVLRMFEHVYKTFYRPIILTNIGPGSEQGDQVWEQLVAFVNKVFEGRDGDNLSIEGLRRIIIIHPLILECFQPFTTANTSTTTLYACSSETIPAQDEHGDRHPSLHLVDITNHVPLLPLGVTHHSPAAASSSSASPSSPNSHSNNNNHHHHHHQSSHSSLSSLSSNNGDGMCTIV